MSAATAVVRVLVRGTLAFGLLGVAWVATPVIAQSGPVQYGYDALGRLVMVVDGTGDAAIYRYDAVGNLLSIERVNLSQLPGAVAIAYFTPDRGPVGTSVSIFGKGFGATPAQNTVAFNGAAATVTSASANRLIATVPANVTTGPITVTVPGGTATSAEPYTVTGLGPPTIASFSPPIAVAGASVSITGTNFEPSAAANVLRANVTVARTLSAAPTVLGLQVPAETGSGRLAVTTPAGTATSTADLFIPPPPYTVADVGFTGRMALGEAKVVTLGTAGQVGLAVFDAAAGQPVGLGVTAVTMPQAVVTILGPRGGSVASVTVGTSGGSIPLTVMPLTGTYTALVDPTGTNTGSLTLTAGGPDLVAVSVSGPTTPILRNLNGTWTFPVTFTIRNNGTTTATGQWWDGLIISPDTIGNYPVDPGLGGWLHTTSEPVAPGASYTRNLTVTAPSSLAPGPYYLIAGADDNRELTETVETNNSVVSAAQVTLSATVNAPDLVAVSVTGPTSPVLRNVNGTWTFPVTFTIRNDGAATASGQWWDGVIISPDTIGNYPADPGVSGWLHTTSEPVAPGASYTRNLTAVAPSSLAPGSYYLIAGADDNHELAETVETNNSVVSATQVTLSATVNAPDLVAVSISGPGTPVLRNTNGTWSFPVTFTIRNDGAATASGQWWDGVIISADTTPNYPADPGVSGWLHPTSEPVAPGASYTRNLIAVAPSSLAPGPYYLFGGADDNHELVESVETNNTVMSTAPVTLSAQVGQPDLVITSIVVPTAPVLRNLHNTWTFPLSWTIQNAGPATANGQWWDGAVVSADTIQNYPIDPGIGGVLHTGGEPVPPYASYTRTITAGVPASVTPGTYYVIAGADSNHELTESNEANNEIISTPITLSATYQGPDLVVTAVTGPAGPVARNANGTWTVPVTWTMRNNGNLAAPSGYWDSVFLSSDTVWNSGDAEIAWANRTTTVAPGVSYTATFSATVASSIAPGTYYLIGVADRWSQIAELSESNNQLAPLTVTLNP